MTISTVTTSVNRRANIQATLPETPTAPAPAPALEWAFAPGFGPRQDPTVQPEKGYERVSSSASSVQLSLARFEAKLERGFQALRVADIGPLAAQVAQLNKSLDFWDTPLREPLIAGPIDAPLFGTLETLYGRTIDLERALYGFDKPGEVKKPELQALTELRRELGNLSYRAKSFVPEALQWLREIHHAETTFDRLDKAIDTFAATIRYEPLDCADSITRCRNACAVYEEARSRANKSLGELGKSDRWRSDETERALQSIGLFRLHQHMAPSTDHYLQSLDEGAGHGDIEKRLGWDKASIAKRREPLEAAKRYHRERLGQYEVKGDAQQ